jgi:hypothetical protein
VLFIQMRFPALYYELLKDDQIAGRLSDILSLKKLEQDAEISRSSEAVRAMYSDQGLTQFLAATQDIPCSAEKIKPWIQLTRGASVS